MVITETIEIGGISYERTYSDSGRYVCRDGQQWEEAVDPLGSGREYTEGDLAPDAEESARAILSVLLGGFDD